MIIFRVPSRKVCRVFLPLVVVFSFYNVFATVASGNNFKAFFWTQATEGASKTGCYGYTKIYNPASGSGEDRYDSKFWFPTYGWWHTLFPQAYLPCSMSVSKEQPAAVTRASGHFSNIPWFTGFIRSDIAESIRFYFPLMPQPSAYGRYDYFTVNADSTTELEFYGAGDSIMVGTFVDKKPATNGSVNILARNAFIIELTKSNPLRISSIRCNGQFRDRISSFLGYDLSKLNKNAAWYGIDFIDTTTPPVIRIHSVRLQGTMPLAAESTSKIAWSLEGSSIVDSCLVYASFDSTKTWNLTGRVVKDSSYIWTVPLRKSSAAFIKVTACGTNTEKLSSISSQFSTTINSSFSLTLQPNANSSIIATWNTNEIKVPKAKAVCLAYRSGSAAQSIDDEGLDTVMHSLSTDHDTISGLQTGTMYYFTAFIVDSSNAFILSGPDAVDSAYAEDRTPPANNFILSAKATDTSHAALSWHANGSTDDDIDSIGIWYNEFRFPAGAHDTDCQKAGIWSAADTAYTLTGLRKSTNYYFALFVADSTGNWSASTQQSQVQIRTPAGENTVVQVNSVNISGSTPQSLFGDSVKIWSTDLKSVFIDTIDPWNPPKLEGFTEIGPAFSFRYGMLPAGSSVSFELVPGSLPDGYSIGDIRVYRYNIYTGGIRLEEGSFAIDTTTGVVTVTTGDLRLPLILMIDTIAPEITIQNTDTAAHGAQQPITDTFMVKDNIENPTISLLAGAGNLGYSDISLYAVPGKTKNRYYTTIPAYVADPCSGLRAFFSANDGKNGDTVNLSRKILRTTINCDDIQTKEMTWTPLVITAQCDHNSLSGLLAAAKKEESFSYNKEEERIIQWLPLSSNASSSDKWVEYSTENDSLFTLNPGKLFWIKTKQGLPLSFGRAVVPALIDTFEISLAEKEWTDFSLPYNFQIYSGDITGATETGAKGSTDSIELYQWKNAEESGSFTTDPLRLPGIDAASDPKTVFEGGGAFTAYNSSGKTIRLKIPPVCTPLSSIGSSTAMAKKTTATRQWSVRIGFSGQDGANLPPVYCAALPSDNTPRFFSCPPSLLPFSAVLSDPSTHRQYGHMANGSIDEGGTTYQISYTNNSDKPQSLVGRIEKRLGLPQGITARLFAKSERAEKSLPADSTMMRLAPHSTATGYLVVGTETYVADFVRNVTAVFSFAPFTVNRSLNIRYSLPFGARKMSLALFDLKGRRVEQFIKETGLQPGEGLFSVQSMFSPGYYIVQMRVEIDGKKDPLVRNKRWLYVR